MVIYWDSLSDKEILYDIMILYGMPHGHWILGNVMISHTSHHCCVYIGFWRTVALYSDKPNFNFITFRLNITHIYIILYNTHIYIIFISIYNICVYIVLLDQKPKKKKTILLLLERSNDKFKKKVSFLFCWIILVQFQLRGWTIYPVRTKMKRKRRLIRRQMSKR